MSPHRPPPSREQILAMASVVEGGMALLAIGLAWIFNISYFGERDALSGAIIGLAAAAPMFIGLAIICFFGRSAIEETFEAFSGVLRPFLVKCGPFDIIAISAMAGIGEELLFRGIIQTSITESAGPLVGIAVSSLFFGLLHAVTPLYAALATIAGFYLGGLYQFADSIWAPIVTHGIYDCILLLYFMRKWKAE